MKSDHNAYVQAEVAKNEIYALFTTPEQLSSVFNIVFHLRGKYITDAQAADLYAFLLQRTYPRKPAGVIDSVKSNYTRLVTLVQRAPGLITQMDFEEMNVVLRELNRLAKC